MMKACELKVKYRVNSRVSLKSKVRQERFGNVKFKKTCLFVNLKIYDVCVRTSTQVVNNEKEKKYAYSLLQLS